MKRLDFTSVSTSISISTYHTSCARVHVQLFNLDKPNLQPGVLSASRLRIESRRQAAVGVHSNPDHT